MSVPALTPMMRQYFEVKEKHKDAILFYRLGDFYEMFYEDAEKASKLLNLTLTSRNKNQENSVPLCGVPHHSARGYINKLVALGYKVAICEQMEDPKTAKGVVKREVVSVVTPGLMMDPDALSAKSQNFLVALFEDGGKWGLAYTDISTGSFQVTEFATEEEVESEISRLDPSEILIPNGTDQESLAKRIDSFFPSLKISPMEKRFIYRDRVEEDYRSYFKAPVEGLGLLSHPAAMMAGGMVLLYLSENRLLTDKILNRPQIYWTSESMTLDPSAKRNLELTRTLVDGSVRGSVFWLLDQAQTPMGSRKVKEWLLYPLLSVDHINARLDSVEELIGDLSFSHSLNQSLKPVADLERLQNRVIAGLANARDLIALKNSLKPVEEVKEKLLASRATLLRDIHGALDPLKDLVSEIEKSVVDEPPLAIKEGGMIREGVNADLDELKNLERDGKSFIAAMEAAEREKTGISSLKIRFNKVFGYSIEVTHTHAAKIPIHYIRKQTLTTAERYITPELKEYEEKILHASEKICALEYQMLLDLRARVAAHTAEIKKTADALGSLDALLSLARVAEEGRYCRPEVVEEPVLEITKGRHPLVEVLFRQEPFVPNDVVLNTTDHRLILITGPNMAGKSTVMRQTALIVLMAQMGGYVPAERAKVGISDRIFTRIGASDFLQKGQSTFMVEMLETSQILSQATERSLIILDEIGRGTSTFDGLSIAWAVAETLHDKIKARTLFATHYHELTDLEKEKEGIKNFHMTVKEWNGQILFLREMKEGASSRSYGVQVAAMAGIPEATVKRAHEILRILEDKDRAFIAATQNTVSQTAPIQKQPSLFDPPVNLLIEKIQSLNPDQFTPLEALQFLYQLKKESHS